MKSDPLTQKQIMQYRKYANDRVSSMRYYFDENSNYDDSTIMYDYNNSKPKYVIDYWKKMKFDEGDLVNVDGYETRLITLSELRDNFNFKYNDENWNWTYSYGCGYWISKDDLPKWLMDYNFYTMSNTRWDYDFSLCGPSSGVWTFYNQNYQNTNLELAVLSIDRGGGWATVRPVINLKKSAIGKVEKGSVCTPKYVTKLEIDYSLYTKGKNVTYNNDEYYVLETSKKDQNYVTLLKKDPLTYNELVSHKGKYSEDFIEDNNGVGLANYFKSDTCYLVNADYDNHIYEDVNIGCTNEYEKSFVKNVLDNWSKDKFKDEDLVSIDGYKVRLLKVDELLDKLGYDINNIITDNHYLKTDNVPWWIYDSKYNYWTMSGLHDFNRVVYTILKNGNVNAHDFGTGGCGDNCVYSKNAIRPVINVDKCALTGGCFIDTIEVEDGCLEDVVIEGNIADNKEEKIEEDKGIIDKVIVSVANTLKLLPQIILVISILLIIGGISILGYNYIKSRRERK